MTEEVYKNIHREDAIIRAGENIPAGRFVDLIDSKLYLSSGDSVVHGVSVKVAAEGEWCPVQTVGAALVDAATDFSKGDLVACGTGGYAGGHFIELVSLGVNLRGADAQDDLIQTNLPAKIQAVCVGDETGHKMVVYGLVGTDFVKEEVDLGIADTYPSTNTFDTVFAIDFTDDAVGDIDVQTDDGNAIIAATISGGATARFYGALVSPSTDVKGGTVRIYSRAETNIADVALMGVGSDGQEQFEIITLDSNNSVSSIMGWREVSYLLIGADGLVWNAGNESRYYWKINRTASIGVALQDVVAGEELEVELYQSLSDIQKTTPWVGGPFAESTSVGSFTRPDYVKVDLVKFEPFANGVLGLYAKPPTTPSSQITGGGATEWRVDVSEGVALGHLDPANDFIDANTDLVVHDGSKLLDVGECITAALLVDYTGANPSLVTVMGPVIPSDFATNEAALSFAGERSFLYDPTINFWDRVLQQEATDALIEAALGSTWRFAKGSYVLNWCWVAMLCLERTGDTVVVQRQYNMSRDVALGAMGRVVAHRCTYIGVLEAHERAAKLLGITL